MESGTMICDNCGYKDAMIRKGTRFYGKGKNQFLIENIPIIRCPNCGESYLTADTLHEIERLKLHRKSLAVEKSIDVVQYS